MNRGKGKSLAKLGVDERTSSEVSIHSSKCKNCAHVMRESREIIQELENAVKDLEEENKTLSFRVR